MSATRIDICVCTFRRPFVVDTLQSLARLIRLPEWNLRVIVVDNDDTPSAQPVVEAAFAALPFPGLYRHAPARNIAIARNACLEAADAPLLAFIDDDETADPPWLVDLVAAQARTQAAAVLGPVDAVYAADAPAWMVRGNFHATRPVWVGGTIITGYSCNLLLNRAHPALTDLRFRLELGTSGGEDTVFLATVHARGGTIAYAPDAMVHEPVPANRATLLWLLKRRFRSGQTHGLLLAEKQTFSLANRTKQILIATAKLGFCAIAAAAHALRRDRAAAWALRGAVHAGVVAKLLGKKELTHYGA